MPVRNLIIYPDLCSYFNVAQSLFVNATTEKIWGLGLGVVDSLKYFNMPIAGHNLCLLLVYISALNKFLSNWILAL